MAIQISTTNPIGVAQTTVTGQRPVANPAPALAADMHAAEPARPVVQPEALQQAIEAINRKLEQSNQNLQFSIDEDTGKSLVKIVDTATHQVIRQIPSEVAIAISRSLEKLQGLLVRQRV